MPSVSTPPADGGGTPSLPELATVMQEDGTREENANILNLFLSGSDLLVGAPSPISAARTTEPVDGLVFSSNFTRERYGKAAVSDNITLESDRRSLLLDDNQTNEQKAVSLVAALEFENGLAAVQNMSDADVTATESPSDIDQFERRPESMYLNTADLSGPKRDALMPAFRGQAEPEFIDAMVSEAGGDAANFVTFGDVVADQTIMQSIAADDIATSMLSSHPNGASEMALSQTAMDAVAASQTAMDAVAASQTAVDAVVASQTAMDAVAASQTAMDAVVASETAVDAVAGSQTAMDAVAGSQTAMDAVAASQTALDAVAGSQTATDAVSASSTAINAIEGASSSGSDSVPITNNASIYVAELAGGGGGGGYGFDNAPGGDAGDTSFHQSVAEGGEGGGGDGANGANGGGTVNSPDAPINISTGGGGSGGSGNSGGGSGGNGGFVKVLIVNPDRQSLSLTVGSGGSAPEFGIGGDGGSATIFTPNVF